MVIILYVEMKKTEEIKSLEGDKQLTRYRLTSLRASKEEKRYNGYYEDQRTAWKVNVALLAVINRKK